MSQEQPNQANQANQANQPEFTIQRIYIKDASFKAPNTPQTFKAEWRPEVQLDIRTNANPLEQDHHEVVLTVTVTVKIKEQTAFLAEVQQAGIFMIRLFPEDQLKQLLGSYCPNILFPFAREAVSDLVTRGGFPPLYLAPINFDLLYQQHLQSQKTDQTSATEGNVGHA